MSVNAFRLHLDARLFQSLPGRKYIRGYPGLSNVPVIDDQGSNPMIIETLYALIAVSRHNRIDDSYIVIIRYRSSLFFRPVTVEFKRIPDVRILGRNHQDAPSSDSFVIKPLTVRLHAHHHSPRIVADSQCDRPESRIHSSTAFSTS